MPWIYRNPAAHESAGSSSDAGRESSDAGRESSDAGRGGNGDTFRRTASAPGAVFVYSCLASSSLATSLWFMSCYKTWIISSSKTWIINRYSLYVWQSLVSPPVSLSSLPYSACICASWCMFVEKEKEEKCRMHPSMWVSLSDFE
jgi:hypothetical protein